MSNTSEALKNVRALADIVQRDGPGWYRSRLEWWLDRACAELENDLVLGDNVSPYVVNSWPYTDPRTMLHCERCSADQQWASVAEAADFRDRHYYCGTNASAWRCEHCNHWEFSFSETCRYCGHERATNVPRALLSAAKILEQAVLYDVYIDGEWRAGVSCDSLLRAKRAARGMYPGLRVELQALGFCWHEGGGLPPVEIDRRGEP